MWDQKYLELREISAGKGFVLTRPGVMGRWVAIAVVYLRWHNVSDGVLWCEAGYIPLLPSFGRRPRLSELLDETGALRPAPNWKEDDGECMFFNEGLPEDAWFALGWGSVPGHLALRARNLLDDDTFVDPLSYDGKIDECIFIAEGRHVAFTPFDDRGVQRILRASEDAVVLEIPEVGLDEQEFWSALDLVSDGGVDSLTKFLSGRDENWILRFEASLRQALRELDRAGVAKACGLLLPDGELASHDQFLFRRCGILVCGLSCVELAMKGIPVSPPDEEGLLYVSEKAIETIRGLDVGVLYLSGGVDVESQSNCEGWFS